MTALEVLGFVGAIFFGLMLVGMLALLLRDAWARRLGLDPGRLDPSSWYPRPLRRVWPWPTRQAWRRPPGPPVAHPPVPPTVELRPDGQCCEPDDFIDLAERRPVWRRGGSGGA
jgi:hypothetical protein